MKKKAEFPKGDSAFFYAYLGPRDLLAVAMDDASLQLNSTVFFPK